MIPKTHSDEFKGLAMIVAWALVLGLFMLVSETRARTVSALGDLQMVIEHPVTVEDEAPREGLAP